MPERARYCVCKLNFVEIFNNLVLFDTVMTTLHD